ncbi:hypothetical protein MG293_019259 [Ovis ammon polii]|uniref:Uncharacterized protein n=1 Tax=Ovis ammon polii TaxID=230172 RepID=A0AAD4TQ71_OVIAM|nr:hypothetical protein MG293_019259 [Ovis ammon polii]KAI4550682.1 hypothetical protein MJT46_018189 [Ovis ammon polii x Ovis aries]
MEPRASACEVSPVARGDLPRLGSRTRLESSPAGLAGCGPQRPLCPGLQNCDFLLSFRWAGSLDGEAVAPLSEEKPPQGFRIKSQKRGCFGEKQEQCPGFPDSTAGPPFSSGAVCFGVGLAELSLLGKPPFRQLLLGTAAMMGIKGARRGRDL